MHNLERWWSPVDCDFLGAFKGAIDAGFAKNDKRHSCLLVAFCRTLLDLSNAAFHHQPMSFKSNFQPTADFDTDLERVFLRYLGIVLDGAEHNPTGQVKAHVLMPVGCSRKTRGWLIASLPLRRT